MVRKHIASLDYFETSHLSEFYRMEVTDEGDEDSVPADRVESMVKRNPRDGIGRSRLLALHRARLDGS